MFREDRTITALKLVVSPSTRQHITRTETWANMMGVRFPADSCIRLAEKHENSLTLGQRGANGGHPDKLQAPNVSQTETTRMIPESPKETKESLSGTDPYTQGLPRQLSLTPPDPEQHGLRINPTSSGTDPEAKGSTRQPCLTPPDSGKPELRRSLTPSGTGPYNRGPSRPLGLIPQDPGQHGSRISPTLSGTEPDTMGPTKQGDIPYPNSRLPGWRKYQTNTVTHKGREQPQRIRRCWKRHFGRRTRRKNLEDTVGDPYTTSMVHCRHTVIDATKPTQ